MTNNMEILTTKSSIAYLPQYLNLYRACFPNALHLRHEYLTWLYDSNPVGSFIGADAIVGSEVVGQVVAIPCEYILRNESVRGLLAVNVAVHPNYQGKFLFKKLGLKMCEFGADAGYDFVIGVANAAATPGWKRQMGFQVIKPLDAMLGIGELGVFSSDSVLRNTEFKHNWQESTLTWRCNNPNNKVFLNNKSGNSLSAFCASGKFGISAYAEIPHIEIDTHRTMNHCLKFIQPRVFLGLNPGYKYKKNYIPVPEKLRPSPLNLIYKNLNNSTDILSPESCLINFLDFDAF